MPESMWSAAGELFQKALTLGGTLTGGHGVGILNKRWLADELGDDQVDLQRRLKAVFDPLGILNPGRCSRSDSTTPTLPPDAIGRTRLLGSRGKKLRRW